MSTSERIYMAIGPQGWSTGKTEEAALRMCVAHIPGELVGPGEACDVQILRVPPGAEMDVHCVTIEWPPENDPDDLRTKVVGYATVRIIEDDDGLLGYERVGPTRAVT